MKPRTRDDLAALVALDTTSHRPVAPLSAFVAERLEALGFRIERVPDPENPGKHDLLASIGPSGTDGLALSGHMDVVPTEGQPWTSDPFVLTPRDGRLYGRGTADMKGFIAACLSALARIPRDAYRRELLCVFTYDEEVGCLGSARFAATWDPARPLPSWCWIGEPTDFQILRAHPGHAHLSLTFEGQAAHSSRPDLGKNAILAASRAIQEIEAITRQLQTERAHEDLLERPFVAVNVARIHGGSAVNIVPDRAVVDVGYRPLPGTPDDAVFQRIRDAVLAIPASELCGCRVSACLHRVTPAMLSPLGGPLQDLLAPHARSPKIGAASFATDGGNLAKTGMQSLVFGPGSIEVAHQADEYVEEAALLRAVDLIEAVVRQRCC